MFHPGEALSTEGWRHNGKSLKGIKKRERHHWQRLNSDAKLVVSKEIIKSVAKAANSSAEVYFSTRGEVIRVKTSEGVSEIETREKVETIAGTHYKDNIIAAVGCLFGGTYSKYEKGNILLDLPAANMTSCTRL